MGKQSAHISSPDIIKQFRARFICFDSECKKALEGIRTNVHRVRNWLQGEQKLYWKRQLRKREEEAEVAKRNYKFARYGADPRQKQTAEDQRKIMMKALRLKEEAEIKLKAIRKWSMTLSQEAVKSLRPCETLASKLASLTPRAVNRLDRMLDNLEIYLRPLPSSSEQGSQQKKGDGDASGTS